MWEGADKALKTKLYGAQGTCCDHGTGKWRQSGVETDEGIPIGGDTACHDGGGAGTGTINFRRSRGGR